MLTAKEKHNPTFRIQYSFAIGFPSYGLLEILLVFVADSNIL